MVLLAFSCTKSNPSVLELKNNWEIQSSEVVKAAGNEISTNEFQPAQWYSITFPATVLAVSVPLLLLMPATTSAALRSPDTTW